MPDRPHLFARHRRDDDGDDELRDWQERRGRFADCDPDTPDRPQIMPVRRPDDPQRETHAHDPRGHLRG